jgi:hypothetical protein
MHTIPLSLNEASYHCLVNISSQLLSFSEARIRIEIELNFIGLGNLKIHLSILYTQQGTSCSLKTLGHAVHTHGRMLAQHVLVSIVIISNFEQTHVLCI